MTFWLAVRRLALGFGLIVFASAVLVFSDMDRRRHRSPEGESRGRPPRVAILQHASTTILDDGVRGIVDALAERGYRDGSTAAIQRFNAHGDMATGTAIARQLTTGEYDLVVTVSTPSMQAVANNNRDGRVRHVFGVVADPFSAGIGLNRENPADHPPHMTGQSTFLPVEDTFQLARRFYPDLKNVGIAWNPAESNSEAFTKKAREACKKLGLTLLEANVDSSSAVGEAINSLVSRGAQMLWVGGDNAMLAAIDSAVATARHGRIPVFTITPGRPDRGTLLDVGLDFYAVGHLTGLLVADVLGGANPATIPVRDVQDKVPRLVVVNTKALENLKDPWRIPDDVIAKADIVVDGTGVHRKPAPARAPDARPLARKWQVHFIQYSNMVETEEAEQGVRKGFKDAGLVEGRDFELHVRNAQGDMVTVSSMVDAAMSEGADLLVTFSTPSLQAAMRRAKNIPIVFTLVANAIAAGAGKTDSDHLPNVTGVYMMGGYDDMLDVIRDVMPSAKRLGTLFVPSEVNTVYHRDRMAEATKKRGYTYETVAANTASEVPDASLSLASMNLDAICQLPGNLTSSAFPSLAQTARRAKVPIFAFMASQARAGAIAAVARDYHDGGHESALMAARVMRGESPAAMPFQQFSKSRVIVNLEAARELGITIPPSVIGRAAEVIRPKNDPKAPSHN